MKYLICLILLALSLSAQAEPSKLFRSYVMKIPAIEVSSKSYPKFKDDLSFKNMKLAIQRQRGGFKRMGLKGNFKMGKTSFPMTKLADSLTKFEALIVKAQDCKTKGRRSSDCLRDLNSEIISSFRVFRPKVGRTSSNADSKFALFTAYYSPIIKVKTQRSGDYQNGIYKKPTNPDLRASTRVEIDIDKKLRGHDLELFWMKDLFDLYILHIEGGGIVEVQDGKNKNKRFYLSYDGTNGQSFRFISKYMRQQGMITTSSMKAQRDYIDAHPEKWREIYNYCPSYVYFKISDDEPAGLEDIPLTSNRSLAQDKTIYKRKGLLSFVQAKRPFRENGQVVFKPFSRFYLDQDTGGAIKGEARADLYFGYGEEAELAAHTLTQKGEIYYLISK